MSVQLTPEELALARAWISECGWEESLYCSDDWVEELTEAEIIKGLKRFYDGGIEAFKRSCREYQSS